ncbi:unnamed protein product [Heligmosomoides polygyrus]|uniref:CDC37_C domain-containing protein n=1 Tax=Heligmosomoides polygyrus TaxID=6339 RepID=A0A183GKZ2_HELPZ|nr:unnamed protein product [Heligmosomoides polygyrus]
MKSVPQGRVRLSYSDLDDYKAELVRRIKVNKEKANEHVEKHCAQMKKYYNLETGDSSRLPKTGDCLFMRVEEEIEVADPQHFLHVRLRCDGQSFPALHGRPARCSQVLGVRDLLSNVSNKRWKKELSVYLTRQER